MNATTHQRPAAQAQLEKARDTCVVRCRSACTPWQRLTPGPLPALDHLEFLKHRVDEIQLATDAQNVRHFYLLGVCARCEHREVGGPEAEQPVPEYVVPMPFEHHPAHVEHLLPFANCHPHAESAAGEDHVLESVNHQEHDQPDHKEK